jgi:hypothetical protein
MDSDRGEKSFRYEVRWEFISDLILVFGGNACRTLESSFKVEVNRDL